MTWGWASMIMGKKKWRLCHAAWYLSLKSLSELNLRHLFGKTCKFALVLPAHISNKEIHLWVCGLCLGFIIHHQAAEHGFTTRWNLVMWGSLTSWCRSICAMILVREYFTTFNFRLKILVMLGLYHTLYSYMHMYSWGLCVVFNFLECVCAFQFEWTHGHQKKKKFSCKDIMSQFLSVKKGIRLNLSASCKGIDWHTVARSQNKHAKNSYFLQP